MKVERLGMAAQVMESEASKEAALAPQAAAIRPVSTTLEARADFGQPSGQDLARRRGLKLDGLDRLVDRADEVLSTLKDREAQGRSQTAESAARLASAASEVVQDLAEDIRPDEHHISPPLPSPLASMRAALRAYSANQEGGMAEAELTPYTFRAIKHAAEVFHGPEGVVKVLGSLGEGGAPTGGISSLVDEISGRLNNLRDEIRVAREMEVDRVLERQKAAPPPFDMRA